MVSTLNTSSELYDGPPQGGEMYMASAYIRSFRKGYTGCTCSKKSPVMNSILSNAPYIFALCFAHDIFTGSMSIAMTRVSKNKEISRNRRRYPYQSIEQIEYCYFRPEVSRRQKCRYAAESIYNSASWYPVSDKSCQMSRYALWRNAVPSFFIHPNSLIIS